MVGGGIGDEGWLGEALEVGGAESDVETGCWVPTHATDSRSTVIAMMARRQTEASARRTVVEVMGYT